ncbi:unnamed protein product (mitochondrion) [Plasmodiophora brassicae]|uniref:Uncharacterized protein n=1 Tax=Plasmodiophora brassicae TaxID=37360 RepID=A0A0G4J1B9_PLABS|nr:hypothetical protein PBRA_001913 [Plasmodiophora brassicae]SPR01340.1 unnamed protein product [Plasmodiophora brassicae]
MDPGRCALGDVPIVLSRWPVHRKELLGRVVSEYNAGRAGDESDAIVALSAICAKSHIGEPFIQDVLQLPDVVLRQASARMSPYARSVLLYAIVSSGDRQELAEEIRQHGMKACLEIVEGIDQDVCWDIRSDVPWACQVADLPHDVVRKVMTTVAEACVSGRLWEIGVRDLIRRCNPCLINRISVWDIRGSRQIIRACNVLRPPPSELRAALGVQVPTDVGTSAERTPASLFRNARRQYTGVNADRFAHLLPGVLRTSKLQWNPIDHLHIAGDIVRMLDSCDDDGACQQVVQALCQNRAVLCREAFEVMLESTNRAHRDAAQRRSQRFLMPLFQNEDGRPV